MQFHPANASIEPLILSTFEGKICQHSPISLMVKEHPIELAYALALVSTGDYYSITPPFVWRAKRDCKNPAFFIHATLFRFFHFLLLADCQEDNFSNHPFSTVFRPFSGVFPGNRPLFGSPFRSFSQKHGIFRRKLTHSPPSLALELVEGPAAEAEDTEEHLRRCRRRENGTNSFKAETQQKHNYILYTFSQKNFTPILWEWKVVFLQR